MLFLIDGIAVELELGIANAVKKWHDSVDDAVIEHQSGKLVEVFTKGGYGKTIRMHYARVIAECNDTNWKEEVTKIIGRPFNDVLDTVCLSRAHHNNILRRWELEAIPSEEGRYFANFFAGSLVEVRFTGHLNTRVVTKKNGDYIINDIKTAILLDVGIRGGISGRTYWDSKAIKLYLGSMKRRVLVDERSLGNGEFTQFLGRNNVPLNRLEAMNEGGEWSRHIANELISRIFASNQQIRGVEATIVDGPYVRSVLQARR